MLNSSDVAALTQYHIFRGTIITGTRRLSDALNDTMSDYVELKRVKVYTVTAPKQPTHSLTSVHVKKSRLLLVAILDEDVSIPTGRLYSYVEKVKRHAILFVRGLQVDGTIFLTSQGEEYRPLAGENEQFIPVTEATIRSVINPGIRIRGSTVLINSPALQGYYYEEVD